jgi:coproporphyrinogen III oxidase
MKANNELVIKVSNYLVSWQQSIKKSLISYDKGSSFNDDNWSSSLGSGKSSVISNSAIFESAGVNFSHVAGSELPAASLPGRSELTGKPFIALGVSTVIHPLNPYIPTAHANLRFFIVDPDSENPHWWFGGGFDLTPYYANADDCALWHKNAKHACDKYEFSSYDKYKKWCDDYFYLPHRKEARGIGGLFFDDLNEFGFEKSFSFIGDVGAAFVKSYQSIVGKRKDCAFGAREREFQAYRRGRYVEFNLLYDRGTKFGLESGGRVESILMSLPKHVSWKYNWQPEPGSAEADLYENYLVPRDWV